VRSHLRKSSPKSSSSLAPLSDSSRGEASALCTQMARNYKQRLGAKCDQGWPSAKVQVSPAPFSDPSKCAVAKGPSEKTGPFRRNSGYAPKKGHRGCPSLRLGASILLPYVLCSKENRGFSSSNRLETSEQAPGGSKVQNGVSSFDQGTAEQRGVCSHSGHERCIFSCASSHVTPSFPSLRNKRYSVPLSSSVLRPSNSPVHFHEGSKRNGRVPSSAGDSNTPLSGRLVTASKVSRGVTITPKLCAGVGSPARYYHQSREVEPSPLSDFRIPRGPVRSVEGSCLSLSEVGRQGHGMGSASKVSSECQGSRLPCISRPPKLCGRFCTSRQTASETLAVLPEMFLQGSSGSSREGDSSEPSVFPSSSLVGVEGKPSSGRPATPSRTSTVPSVRFQRVRLGCSSWARHGLGHLGQGRGRFTHKPPRNEGRHPSIVSLPSASQGELHQDSLRQHHGSFIHSASGGNSFHCPFHVDSRPVQLLPASQHFSKGGLHSGQKKCYGRQSQSPESSAPRGVDVVSVAVQTDSQAVPYVAGRPLCNIFESPAPSIRQSLSRRPIMGYRCDDAPMGRPDSLRLSSGRSDCAGSPEGSHVQLSPSVNSSSVANPSMVPDPPGPSGGVSSSPPRGQEVVAPANVQHFSLKPKNVGPARVAIIERSLIKDGFSEEVARRAARPQKLSSCSVYESHFAAFQNWLSERGSSLESVSIPLIGDYFLYLFVDLKRSAATVANHRSALSDALPSFDGFTVGSHPVLSNLLNNFKQDRPTQRQRVPEWDLIFVLEKLLSAPFEPPSYGSIQDKQFLTWKTCFLLALASTKRASEIHAISRDKRDLVFSTRGVSLRTVPGFLAKTQAANIDPKPFFIPRHDSFSGRDTPDRLLCPVRMLKFYLRCTGGYKEASPLFVKCRGEGPVSTKTISSWLKKVICYAYDNDPSGKAVHPRGHDVRKLSASWAFSMGIPVRDILQAGSWARVTTFTSHYLHDVEPQLDGKRRLCPVVACSNTF